MPGPRIAVVVYPGTNCELDVIHALSLAGGDPEPVFHTQRRLTGYAAAVLAGGFAHGDYLRPGALARFSPVTDALREIAASGAPVLGICNGFQILCESGLLDGALQKNAGLRFICAPVDLRVETTDSSLTVAADEGEVLRAIPINHFAGNFTADRATLEELETQKRVILRYVDKEGRVTPDANPNGSANSIAGICNETRNVVGLMPHPERAAEKILGSDSGLVLLRSFVTAAASFASSTESMSEIASAGAKS